MNYLTERRRLGKPSEEVIESMKRREEEKEKIREILRPKVVICGLYCRDTVIQAQIAHYQDIDDFFFKTIEPIMEYEQKKQMMTAMFIKYRSGALMYKARPYTTLPGQIKLFLSVHRKMMRCQIKDLFTVNEGGTLDAHASIQLIDTGAYLKRISFKFIYDIPQRIGFYGDLEPETKPCRLHLSEKMPLDYKDADICKYVREKITKNPLKQFSIKILDFKNDVYHIDIVDQKGASLIEHLRVKFHEKIQRFNGATLPSDKIDHPFYEVNSLNANNFNNHIRRLPSRAYLSVVSYYKKMFGNIKDYDKSTSYYHRRFFQVKVLCWNEPDSFAIIPVDEDYTSYHKQFMKEVDEFQDRKDEATVIEDHRFVVGEKCLFLNNFDSNLGKWLRGVVVKIADRTDLGKDLMKLSLDDDRGKNSNLDTKNCLTSEVITKNLMYRLRSIDYGFETMRGSIDMRPVSRHHMCSSRGPWSLKCRLFGVYPLDHAGERQFSSSCKDMIDCWLRARILDDGRNAFFNAIFKNDIQTIPDDDWNLDDHTMDIVLFHKFEHPYRIEDMMFTKKRKPRYDCLNSFLIDRGLASDCNPKTGRRSFVDLDDYIVNLLVQHDMLQSEES